MTWRLGAHLSIAGGDGRGAPAAKGLGMTAVQVFTKSNSQWNARPLADAAVEAFRVAVAEAGITEPVGHNSYLINLGSPDDALWRKSIDAMTVEVERAEELGLAA